MTSSVIAKKNFYDLDLPELIEFIVGKNIKSFRAKQLMKWVYAKEVTDICEMTDISKDLREELAESFVFELPKLLKQWDSSDGTKKFLLDVGDGLSIETVLIPSKDRYTLCVSSEVGCNLACKFCYTAKYKLKRKLKTSEIVGQYIQVSRLVSSRISNVVFMGMGEPLDNPEAVFKSINIFHEPLAFNLSRKKITLSTSGIVPLIPKVTESGVRLAVSLNSADDETRSKLMPINKRWPLKDLLQACKNHVRKAQDKITFEYILIKGVTDSLENAQALHDLIKGIPCKINIIPFNEHPGSTFLRPSEESVEKFQKRLIQLGTYAFLRKTMGRDIYAACGQLVAESQ